MALFNYDQQAAQNAGSGGGASESGAYEGLLTNHMVTAQSGAKGIEFSLKGAFDVNYLTLYYEKKTGGINDVGHNMINAIMGITRVQQINVGQMRENGQPVLDEQNQPMYTANELNNKPVGLVLRKELYTKTDEARSDGYKFDIVAVYDPQTRQTIEERDNNHPPQKIDRILSTLTDKDSRTNKGGNSQGGGYNASTEYGRPTSKFDQVPSNQAQTGDFMDDDIPY